MTRVTKPKVLLFEDNLYLGKQIRSILQKWGFTVCWVIKIQQIYDYGLRCICFDAGNEPPDNPPCFIEFGEMCFAFALLDGTLGKTSRTEDGPHGWDILPHLRRHGMSCIAISNDEHVNQKMVEDLGAKFSTPHKHRRPDLFETELQGFLTSLELMPSSATNTSANTT